jgi:hypothetical protein
MTAISNLPSPTRRFRVYDCAEILAVLGATPSARSHLDQRGDIPKIWSKRTGPLRR